MMFNRRPPLWKTLAFGLMMPAVAAAQDSKLEISIPEQANQAATKALQTFQNLAAPQQNSLMLGLNEPGEASRASLGPPTPDYVIDLDALKKWDGGDPKALLRPTGQLVYPITVQGATRTSVTIAQLSGEWKAASFGSAQEAKARTQIRDHLNANAPGGSAVPVQVRVPALNAVFLAQEIGNQLEFTPVTSRPSLKIKAGETEPAKQILLRMQPIAKELNPNVPN